MAWGNTGNTLIVKNLWSGTKIWARPRYGMGKTGTTGFTCRAGGLEFTVTAVLE